MILTGFGNFCAEARHERNPEPLGQIAVSLCLASRVSQHKHVDGGGTCKRAEAAEPKPKVDDLLYPVMSEGLMMCRFADLSSHRAMEAPTVTNPRSPRDMPASTALPRPSTAPPSKAFLGAILCAFGVSSSARYSYTLQVGREPGHKQFLRFFTNHAANYLPTSPKPRLSEGCVQQHLHVATVFCRAWPLLLSLASDYCMQLG